MLRASGCAGRGHKSNICPVRKLDTCIIKEECEIIGDEVSYVVCVSLEKYLYELCDNSRRYPKNISCGICVTPTSA